MSRSKRSFHVAIFLYSQVLIVRSSNEYQRPKITGERGETELYSVYFEEILFVRFYEWRRKKQGIPSVDVSTDNTFLVKIVSFKSLEGPKGTLIEVTQ